MSDQKTKRLKHHLATAAGVTVTSLLVFKILKYITRDPGDQWIVDYLKANTGKVANLWIPGVGTRSGQTKQEVEEMVRKQLIPGKCEIAFFPYSSLNLPLDLLAALLDKLRLGAFRPQIQNIAVAIATFLAHFDNLHIVCHSHGAMLLKAALMLLGNREDGNKITIHAFGPAELVPFQCKEYKVQACLNWVLVDDVLVRLGVLDLPKDLVTREQVEKETSHHFEWGPGYLYSVYVSSLHRVRKTSIWKHGRYPFSIGIDC